MDACCGAGFMRGIFPVVYVWKGSGALYAVQCVFSAIAVLYPLIISIVCGMSASVEEQAVFSDDAGGAVFENRQFCGQAAFAAPIECVIGRSRHLSLFGGDEICSSHQ